MLMKFIWIHVGLYRREKGGWNGQKDGLIDWKMTEQWWLPWSVHNWESTEVNTWKYSLDKKYPRHSRSSKNWLVSEGAVRLACYLVQTRNNYLTSVGTDVGVQMKPLPLLSARLENEACDGRMLRFRMRPLQNNTCWALISRQSPGGLQFTSPRWRIWCGRNKKDL